MMLNEGELHCYDLRTSMGMSAFERMRGRKGIHEKNSAGWHFLPYHSSPAIPVSDLSVKGNAVTETTVDSIIREYASRQNELDHEIERKLRMNRTEGVSRSYYGGMFFIVLNSFSTIECFDISVEEGKEMFDRAEKTPENSGVIENKNIGWVYTPLT
jgi:hypothetical protein